MIKVYKFPETCPHPKCIRTHMYKHVNMFDKMHHRRYFSHMPVFSPDFWDRSPHNSPNIGQRSTPIRPIDYGPHPFAVNIEEATKQNDNFRTALWTGAHLQLTLMSINVGEDIGLEVHPYLDQFIRLEQGKGIVMMGDDPDRLDFRTQVKDDYAFIIPAGKWHNLINTGYVPIKLYSIYAPPQHPFATVHKTKEDDEEHHRL